MLIDCNNFTLKIFVNSPIIVVSLPVSSYIMGHISADINVFSSVLFMIDASLPYDISLVSVLHILIVVHLEIFDTKNFNRIYSFHILKLTCYNIMLRIQILLLTGSFLVDTNFISDRFIPCKCPITLVFSIHINEIY